MLRGLGGRGRFQVPGWGDFLVRHGTVVGTPENRATLMRTGQSFLVFPGGGRKVMRRKGETYTPIWKQRTGFTRLAIKHGHDIIPFASVGPDESFKIMLDANDVMHSWLWKRPASRMRLAEVTCNGDMIPPIMRGLGPTMPPWPQRYYFGFGQRIATAHLNGRAGDKDVAWALREQVAQSV